MLRVCAGGFVRHDRKSLHDIPITPRIFGGRVRSGKWQGIQHGELVEGFITSIQEKLGYLVVPETETYFVSPNGAVLVGGFCIGQKDPRTKLVEPLRMVGVPQETQYALGFTHGNDSSRALEVYGGGSVFYCTNGVITCQDRWKRKHTSGLRLIGWLKDCLSKMWGKFEESTKWLERLSLSDCTQLMVDDALLALARRDILSWRHIGEVDDMWTRATSGDLTWMPHNENDNQEDSWEFRKSLWDFYNCVTHVAKKLPASCQLPAIRNGFELLKEYATLPDPEETPLHSAGRV